MMNAVVGAMMVIAGAYTVYRSVIGGPFYLTGIGGSQHGKALPNWIARPLVFLIGVGAILLGIMLLRQR